MSIGVRETILNSLVSGLDQIDDVQKATEYFLSLDATEDNAPIISMRVEGEEPTFKGSNRYRTTLGLYVLTDQTRVGIEGLIESIKQYVKTASITNMLELLYVGHEDVPKEAAVEGKYSSVKITLSLLYKDTNEDTAANVHPSTMPTGYMAISNYKTYALMVSGSTDIQSLGTNVYDSHKNANIEIPLNSGSISVDIINSEVVEAFRGSAAVDDNIINISVRAHFAPTVLNDVIAPIVANINNVIKTHLDFGNSYRVLRSEPFIIQYDQTFEESDTVGAEILFAVHAAQTYSQV